MTMSAIGAADILCKADGDVRYTSIEAGAQSWREGNLQVGVTSTGQCIIILNFKIGRPRSFKLTNNVKGITKVQSNPGRVTLALRDGANISLNKGNFQEVERLNEFLNGIKNAKSGKLNGTRSFDLIKSPQTPKHNSNNVSFQSKVNGNTPSNIRPLGNSSNSSTKKYSPPTNVASRRSRAGLGLDSDGSISSDEENAGRGVPDLFVEEQDEQLDKENRSSGMERSVYRQRKQDGGSMFARSAQEQLDTFDEKKAKTPAPITHKNFYGSGSRGKDMVNASRARLGGGAAFSTRTLNGSIKRPGMMEPTPNYVKKARLLDTYDGWNKGFGSKPTNINLQGFSNLGNTCYMNAILQSIFGLNSFTNDLLRQDVMRAVAKVSLYWAVTSLLRAKQERQPTERIGNQLRLVKTAISATATRFSGFMQHDAHEFLCQCMDQLKEDVDKANKKRNGETNGKTKPIITNGDTKPIITNGDTKPVITNGDTKPVITNGDANPIITNGDHSTKKQEPRLPCPVTNNFEFEVLHTITCKDCGEIVTKTEQFYDLSVDMPRIGNKSGLSANIQTALDQFFKQEEIEYTCNECGGKMATVMHKFTKLPRILILHIKRYTFDVEASVNAKLRQPIGIPKYLTLHWHCSLDTSPPKEVTRTNGVPCTSSSSDTFPNEDQHVADGQSNIRKRLSFQTSPKADAKKPFTFSRKRIRRDSDAELEKDPFALTDEDDETQRAIKKSKAEEDKRKLDESREEDLVKKALEDSKKDVGGVKEITNMTEEEQIEYALALSRGEEWPTQDANGNHKTTQNGITNGIDEPDRSSETRIVPYVPPEQRLLIESDKTSASVDGEAQTGANQWENIPLGETQWDGTNGDEFSVHNKETNRDSGFVSPNLNGHLNDTEVSENKEMETSANDSAIGLDKENENSTPPNIPPKKSKITDYSNVIDLCGDEKKDAASGGTDEAGNSLSYAELKAKEEEEIRRATELSLKDFKQNYEDTEEAQLRRAQEMSLQEFNQSFESPIQLKTSPQEENQEPMYTPEMLQLLSENIENGEMPHSYRLLSVVNHIGSSSSAGHYVSDVYDSKKKAWFSYDDSDVQKISESTVRENRRKTGYIFFYEVKFH